MLEDVLGFGDMGDIAIAACAIREELRAVQRDAIALKKKELGTMKKHDSMTETSSGGTAGKEKVKASDSAPQKGPKCMK